MGNHTSNFCQWADQRPGHPFPFYPGTSLGIGKAYALNSPFDEGNIQLLSQLLGYFLSPGFPLVIQLEDDFLVMVS